MGANQRTAPTTYSNRGAYGGENIGTGHGEPAVTNTARYGTANAPQKNMSQIIWNAGFSSDAQWSSTDGTSSSNSGPNGSSSTGSSGESGMSGNSHNWSTSVASGTNATASGMAVSVGNAATITLSSGGSGYTSTPNVTVLYDSDGNGSYETTVTWSSGGGKPTVTMSGGSVASITGNTNPGSWSGQSSGFQINIDAAPTSKITLANNACTIDIGTAHTQYIYSSDTNSGQTGLIDITGNTTHWGTEGAHPNIEEETDIHVFIKFAVTGSGGSNTDDIQLLIGTAPDDDTYGIYKINPDMGGVLPQTSPYTASSSAKHGIHSTSGGNYYWRLHTKADGAPVPGFNRAITEKLTLTGADSSASNAVAYGLVSGGSTTGGLSSIVIVSGGSGYTAGEVLTVTGTRSSHAVGRATAVGSGALTGATVTTAGTGYHAGNVCFTLKSRGNTGYSTYVIKQIECYIPNKLETASFSRAPTGDIYAGRNLVTNLTGSTISGDYIDTSVVRGQFDFSYDASDGMQNDFTGTSAAYSYPLDTTAGFRTIRTVAYIDNVTPAGAAWQSNYTTYNNKVGTDIVYIEERNPIFTAHTTEASARGN